MCDDFVLGDIQCPTSFSCYAPYCFESLLLYLQNTIETKINCKLIPTYSYGRIYYNNSILHRHADRKACEISGSLCLRHDENPWEFWICDKNNTEQCVILEEGDMIIYMGHLEHWRNIYTGKKQIQTFLHYVNANGEYTHLKYDKRSFIFENSSSDFKMDNKNKKDSKPNFLYKGQIYK